MGILGGGEAKGRAPGWLCGGAASPEIKSGVATSLCLGPGDGHGEHEFGSHLTKPGATGAAPGAGLEVLPDGLPQQSPISSSSSGHFLAIKMKTRQCLCSVTAGTWFKAQSKTWVWPESLPLLLPSLFAGSSSCLVAFVSPGLSGSEGAPGMKH